MNRPTKRTDRGQALVLFTLLVVGILFMTTLLFDAANALVHRRVLQNTADAAAIAGANVIMTEGINACNGNNGPTPRAVVRDRALAAVAQNANGYHISSIEVTCPAEWADVAVRVTLSGSSPTFFGGIMGFGQSGSGLQGLDVVTTGTAMNGGAPGTNFSVVLLNPHNPGWSANGCPSSLFAGGPTVIFDGNMQVNSACPANLGGALGTNGNAASLAFNNNAFIRITGAYVPGPLVITPPPQTGYPALRDPLLGLPPIPLANLTVRSTSRLNVNNTTEILEPGIYRGGIRLVSAGRILMRPGIYVMDGGGIDAGAQSSIISVSSTATDATIDTWAANCPANDCGVLIYNVGATQALGQVQVSAGATMLIRPYNPSADRTGTNEEAYKNLIIWQDANPVPRSNYSQPQLRLGGGGNVKVSGTVYAPSAPVYMTGGSGGSGGDTNLTLQFIAWDMEIRGNSRFHFIFNSESFARPIQYGLVE